MSQQVVEFPKTKAIVPGGTAVLTFDLVDVDGVTPVNLGAVTSARVTITDISQTGYVFRQDQNCLNTGIGTLVGSTVTLSLASTDTQLVSGGQRRKYQRRMVMLVVAYTNGVLPVVVYFWVRDPSVERE